MENFMSKHWSIESSAKGDTINRRPTNQWTKPHRLWFFRRFRGPCGVDGHTKGVNLTASWHLMSLSQNATGIMKGWQPMRRLLGRTKSACGPRSTPSVRHCMSPCGPDLNPIELAFAKLKHMLRRARERTVDRFRNFCKRPLNRRLAFAPAK